MHDVLLPGIAATTVATSRLTQSVLHPEGVDPAGPGDAVLFVHGNVSSSLFWQQPLLDLAATGRHRALAVDLRGYGDTDPLPIDATRGVRDWADDLAALVDALGLDPRAPGRLEHGRRRGAAVPARRTGAGRVGRARGAGVAVRLRRHGRARTGAACTPTAPAAAAARPTPTSSPRSRPGTPPPTARSARGRCCARSTSRRGRCRWTRSWRTCSSPR